MSLTSRLSHAWNSFRSEGVETRTTPYSYPFATSTSTPPDRPTLKINSERTVVSSIYTRIAVDAASVKMEHCRLSASGTYEDVIRSGLNECLNVNPNLDQVPSHFRQDIFYQLLSEGVIGIIPIDTELDPTSSNTYDIRSMRVGIILDFYPNEVKLEAYNERTGKREQLILPKSVVAIVENPFYNVMNEANSTLKRLVHKLSLLDNVDEISSRGKLDIIIQLPYAAKTDTRKAQANARTQEISDQLQGSDYGIAYADSAEKITQLNRPIENKLLEQVQYLQDQLYAELSITRKVMDGTASDVEMLNYTNRTIEPLMERVVEAMIRTFLTKTARTQGQSIQYFDTPFKLIPIKELADVADSFSRNQIATPNEFRTALGLKPSKSPQADQLVNSNMPVDKQITDANVTAEGVVTDESDEVDEAEAALDAEMAELGIS